MDALFKAAFALMFLALLASVRPVASELRQRTGTGVNQMAHEHPALRLIRPVLGLVFYAALVDWLLPGTRIPWLGTPFPLPIRWCGTLICFAAVASLRASFLALGSTYRGGLGLWDDHVLVVTGPYAVIRHPIYAAFVLIMAGIWMMTGSWVIGTSGLVLTLAVPAIRLPIEESQLRERFGPQYDTYEASTARFLPGVF